MHHITLESIPILSSVQGSGTGESLGGECGIEVGVFKCGGGIKEAVFGVSSCLHTLSCTAMTWFACCLWR